MLTSLAAAAVAMSLGAATAQPPGGAHLLEGMSLRPPEAPSASAAPADLPASARAAAPAPRGSLGLEMLGSTMAGGTGSPWVRDGLYEKHTDARAMREEEARARKTRTITGILLGVGLATLAASASLIASSGGGAGGQAQAREALMGAAGPRGGGAALVFKVGFR